MLKSKLTNADSAAKQKSPDSLQNSGLAFVDPQLYVLYTSSQELLGILKPISKHHKLVFQFFSTKEDKISFVAFVGQKIKNGSNKETEFDSTHILVLKISSDAPTGCNISGKDVLLSSQELNINNHYPDLPNHYAKPHNDIAILYAFLNSNPDKFITFTPILEALNNEIYQVRYQIDYSDKDPKKSLPIIKKVIPGLSKTNPTPPRNSY